MPLSEHEQQLLDQIERALYAEDPKFASTVRSSDLKTHLVRRIRRASVLLVAGLVALVVGAALSQWALGVAGFVLMLGACLVIVRSLQGFGGRDGSPRSSRPARRKSQRPMSVHSEPGERGGMLGKIEARWKRRWEERDR
ncbi:MAG TPA: DUF3040 domain-containing protein [Mycobacteriales bacterium]|nr:DUF3040 domain-containing protein [Mycobacteriales bacterium]